MEAILFTALVRSDGAKEGLSKDVDFPCTPFVGMEIDDTAFENVRKITQVIFDMPGKAIWVVVEPHIVSEVSGKRLISEDDFEEMMGRYKACGWKSGSKEK
ncbi:MAG: hypothetical protein J7M40_18075 [Planctomycetes bacterium]|nr:hypothetical protein [Planctomycetota bacterium]